MTIKFLKSLNPYHDAGNTALKAAGFKHLMSNFFSIWIVHVDQCLPALVLSLLVLHWRGWLQLYVMVLFLISGQYLYLYIARGTFMCVSVYCDVPNSHSKPRRSELFRSFRPKCVWNVRNMFTLQDKHVLTAAPLVPSVLLVWTGDCDTVVFYQSIRNVSAGLLVTDDTVMLLRGVVAVTSSTSGTISDLVFFEATVSGTDPLSSFIHHLWTFRM